MGVTLMWLQNCCQTRLLHKAREPKKIFTSESLKTPDYFVFALWAEWHLANGKLGCICIQFTRLSALNLCLSPCHSTIGSNASARTWMLVLEPWLTKHLLDLGYAWFNRLPKGIGRCLHLPYKAKLNWVCGAGIFAPFNRDFGTYARTLICKTQHI